MCVEGALPDCARKEWRLEYEVGGGHFLTVQRNSIDWGYGVGGEK